VSAERLTVFPPSGVLRPCVVGVPRTIIDGSESSRALPSTLTRSAWRSATTKRTQPRATASRMSFGFDRRLSPCVLAWHGVSPGAAAQPWPMARTPQRAACRPPSTP
jgi:hypothetical protein